MTGSALPRAAKQRTAIQTNAKQGYRHFCTLSFCSANLAAK